MLEQTDGHSVGGALRGAASYRPVESDHHALTTYVTIPPGGDTGLAIHDDLDETVVFLDGDGEAIVDGLPTHPACGGEVFVPAGVQHTIRNTGSTPLHVYTVRDPSVT